MNNNLDNNENNNVFPKEVPIIPSVDDLIGIQEPVQVQQPVSMPSVFPVVEPTVMQEPVAPQQPVSMPSVFPVVEPTVMQEPVQVQQPVNTPSVFPVVEPTVMQEPVQAQQPVSMPSVFPVEEPKVMQEPVAPQQPVNTPSVFPIDEPTSTNEMAQIEPPKKKKKHIKALLIILILLTLCLVGGGVYYAYSANEKVVINNSVKQLENFKEYFQSPLSLKNSDQYSEKGTFNIQMTKTDDVNTNQIIDILNSMKFDYNFSKTTEKTLLELNVSDAKKEIAGVKVLTTSETGYIFLNKLFDKYIEVAELKDALSSTNYNNIEDYNYLYNFVQKSFIKNVDKDDFVKDTAEITIDGDKKQVNSLKLEYNDKEILGLIDLIITDIKADEKANGIVTNLYKDFADYNMTSSIDSIDEEHMNLYTYTVYTSKLTNIVQGIDFDYKYYNQEYNYDNCYSNTSDDTSDSALENMKSTTKDYKATKVADDNTTNYYPADNSIADDNTASDYPADDYTTSDYTTDDYTTTSEYENCKKVTYNEKTVSIQYRKDTNPRIYISEDNDQKGFAELVKDGQISTINIYKSEDEKLGFIKINSTKTLYEVTADFTVAQNEYKLNFSTNIEEVTAGTEYKLDSIITYEQYTGKEKTNSISVNINGTMKNSASIEETTTNSVKYDDLTVEQQQEIYNKLMSILAEKMG